jgi:uncharacterized protein YjbI with pentapeptide repeats
MTPEELKLILEKHRAYLNDEPGGERADLYRANLYRADLYGADLRGANLRGADLYGANLYGARGKVLAIGPIGSRCGITYAYWADGIRIQCGCFSGTLDEFESKCKASYPDYERGHGRSYVAIITAIKEVAAAYNWADGE